MKTIYLASKIAHGPMLYEWQKKNHVAMGVAFTSRWYLSPFDELPDDECFAQWFWAIDVQDVIASDAVLVYGEVGDHLRGALVEAGIALGLNKPVLCVGESPSFGTWQYHPEVYRLPTLEHAKTLIKAWSKLWPA